MKKLLSLAFFGLAGFAASAATLPEKSSTILDDKEIELFQKVPVSWNVTCPNGITYSGTIYVEQQYALAAAQAIAAAPCPN
jgi:hypothetical protein